MQSAGYKVPRTQTQSSLLKVRILATMRVLIQTVLLVVSALSLVSCARDLSVSYPFKVILNPADKGGLYELYWTFDNEAETIKFAVRVETTGWVGFGLSPNGQMPNSDVVIGWVKNDGETIFHVRSYNYRTLLLQYCARIR